MVHLALDGKELRRKDRVCSSCCDSHMNHESILHFVDNVWRGLSRDARHWQPILLTDFAEASNFLACTYPTSLPMMDLPKACSRVRGRSISGIRFVTVSIKGCVGAGLLHRRALESPSPDDRKLFPRAQLTLLRESGMANLSARCAGNLFRWQRLCR